MINIELQLELYTEKSKVVSLPALGSITDSDVTRENFIFGTVEFFEYTKIVADQILVPLQYGTNLIGNLGAAMVDNNFSSISYNNFGGASGTNLPFYTFDFGSPQKVDQFQINWWQFNNYVPNLFRMEASTDNVNWNTIVDNLVGTNIIGNIQYIPTLNSTPYQYWRMFVYSGFSGGASFIVVTEMIPQLAGVTYKSIENSSDVDMFFDTDGKLKVINLINTATQITLRYKEIIMP